MNYYPDFAELLDRYLSSHDRSGGWLAQRLGVNPGTISRWRNGETRPHTPEMVIRIADILGVHEVERTHLLRAVGYAGVVSEVASIQENEAEDKAQILQSYRGPSSSWLDYPITYRQAEMATLAHWVEIEASGMVLGLAGSGVSTLLRYFSNRPDAIATYLSDQKRILPIWLELQPLTEPLLSTFYRLCIRSIFEAASRMTPMFPTDLMQTWQKSLSDSDVFMLQTTFFTALTYCQSKQLRLVFVIDRLDLLSDDFHLTIGNTLRSMRDGFRETILYLLGTRITPTYLDNIYLLGDLGRLLSTHTCIVGSLNELDSRFVISKRTSVAGSQPSESDIEQFLLLSGGYPTLLKAVIRWWLTCTTHLPYSEWHAVLLQETGIQLRLREIWLCLSPQEQTALQTLFTSRSSNAIPDAIGKRFVRLGICRQNDQALQLSGTLFTGMAQFSVGSK